MVTAPLLAFAPLVLAESPDAAAIAPPPPPGAVATAPLARAGPPLGLPEPAEPVELPEAVAALVDASGRSPVDVADEAELQ
jgi:hypothetical protein